MEFITQNADVLAEKANEWIGDWVGSDNPLGDMDDGDLYSVEDATARLFFLTFNTSTTLTTAQAIALVLGLTALIGGLAAAAYFFLLTYKSDSSGYGSGSGSGYGHSSGHGHGHSRSQRSLEEENSLLNIVRLISELEEELKSNGGAATANDEECQKLKICQIIGHLEAKQEQNRLTQLLDQAKTKYQRRFLFPAKEARHPGWNMIRGYLEAANQGRSSKGNECLQTFACVK